MRLPRIQLDLLRLDNLGRLHLSSSEGCLLNYLAPRTLVLTFPSHRAEHIPQLGDICPGVRRVVLVGGDVGVEGGLDVGELFESTRTTKEEGRDEEGCELVYVVLGSSLPRGEERRRFLEEFAGRRKKRGVCDVGVLKGREGSVRIEVGGTWEKEMVDRGLESLGEEERKMADVRVEEEEEEGWWERTKRRAGVLRS